MQVRVLGAHNLETIETHHTCFLVDGVLAIDAGSLVSTLGADEQRATLRGVRSGASEHTSGLPHLIDTRRI